MQMRISGLPWFCWVAAQQPAIGHWPTPGLSPRRSKRITLRSPPKAGMLRPQQASATQLRSLLAAGHPSSTVGRDGAAHRGLPGGEAARSQRMHAHPSWRGHGLMVPSSHSRVAIGISLGHSRAAASLEGAPGSEGLVSWTHHFRASHSNSMQVSTTLKESL
jgi:hypothetical protein